MSELRKGQKVRVTYETVVVSEPEHESDWIVLRNPAPSKGDIILGLQTVTIEQIEDLRPGDVYRELRDKGAPVLLIYVPRHDGDACPWVDGGFNRVNDSYVTRPLTLFVRDGKPVTP